MTKLLVANWKLNIPNLAGWKKFSAPKNVEIVICPPFPYLAEVAKVISYKSKVILGAQDVFWQERGAFTGEVSPIMLKGLGAEYAIIGHSERRHWLGETDEMVNRKVISAFMNKLKPILCVGEPGIVRKKGLEAAKKFVGAQLSRDLRWVKKKSSVVVAYEPIWAIGTGVPDKPEDSNAMAKFIKQRTGGARVLYGGSVKAINARGFLSQPLIDGALVGGASLNPLEFRKIAEEAVARK